MNGTDLSEKLRSLYSPKGAFTAKVARALREERTPLEKPKRRADRTASRWSF